jgi:hypothetical protein
MLAHPEEIKATMRKAARDTRFSIGFNMVPVFLFYNPIANNIGGIVILWR